MVKNLYDEDMHDVGWSERQLALVKGRSYYASNLLRPANCIEKA